MEKETVLEVEQEEKPKKSSKKEVQHGGMDVAVDKLIQDTSLNKYDVILLARRWAYELKAKEGETRSLQDLISVAIQDILGNRVSHKMVSELPQLVRQTKKAKPTTAILDAIPSKSDKDEE